MPDTSSPRFHQDCNQFLLAFSRCLQFAQMYEISNLILNEPIMTLCKQMAALQADGTPFTFQSRESSVLVNGVRLRADGPTFLRHQQFLQMLQQRKVGGMTFEQPLDEAEWRGLMREIVRFNRDSHTPLEDLRDALSKRGITKVILHPIERGVAVARLSRAPSERRHFALRTVSKATVLLKHYIENLNNPSTYRFYQMKLQRVLQDLVTVCVEDGWKFVGFVNNKHADDYLYAHGVNVAMMSIVMGLKLGLKRVPLTELGMAALLHDLGKALLPGGLMNKTGRFTDEERELLKQSPVMGVRALLKSGHYNEALLKRILVLCEHQRPGAESAHPFSKLISVAERFDALTSPRPYRKALLPDAAILKLLTIQDLDRPTVLAFVRAMGLYPPGTLLQLSTGDIAVSFSPNPDPKHYASPIVRLARDNAPVVDPVAENKTVARSLDPAQVKINVTRFLSLPLPT